MSQNKNHYVLIMAGGIGSRFWPVSKKSFPKQFIDIMGTGESLIKQTYNRFCHMVPKENIYVVTNTDYVPLVQSHIPEMHVSQILHEPLAKNTAPCIALANRHITQKNPDAVCLVAPSDHLISNEMAFIETAQHAMNFASQTDALVTLGIKPTRPDTGYGYIQFNPELDGSGLHRVKTFTEKPSEDIAKSFLESGEFLWNAGIFIWSMKAINKSIEKHIPEIYQIFSEVDTLSDQYNQQLEHAYSLTPSISIDYGVLEKEREVFVMPANFGWNDLGTWKSLWDVSTRNEKNNAVVGKNIHTYNTSESLIFNNTQKLIVVNGIDNIVIVESDEVLLVMNKDKEQELKTIVNEIKDRYKGKFN